MLFLVVLHGVSAVKVMTILYLNYNLVTSLPKKYIPVATWVFNIGTLFANEIFDGYQFKDMARLFSADPSRHATAEVGGLIALGDWLDSYGGLQRRWAILFNITILRLISFNLDYYWSLDRRAGSPIEVGYPFRNIHAR